MSFFCIWLVYLRVQDISQVRLYSWTVDSHIRFLALSYMWVRRRKQYESRIAPGISHSLLIHDGMLGSRSIAWGNNSSAYFTKSVYTSLFTYWKIHCREVKELYMKKLTLFVWMNRVKKFHLQTFLIMTIDLIGLKLKEHLAFKRTLVDIELNVGCSETTGVGQKSILSYLIWFRKPLAFKTACSFLKLDKYRSCIVSNGILHHFVCKIVASWGKNDGGG